MYDSGLNDKENINYFFKNCIKLTNIPKQHLYNSKKKKPKNKPKTTKNKTNQAYNKHNLLHSVTLYIQTLNSMYHIESNSYLF